MTGSDDGTTLTIGGIESVDVAYQVAEACYGSKVEPREWWRWYLFGCDAVESRIVFAHRDGQAVGMQALMVMPFTRGSERFTGAVLCGGMVHPEHRRLGLFRRLVESARDEAWRLGADFSLTMPNDRSKPAFDRFEWRDLGDRALYAVPTVALSRRRGTPEGSVAAVADFGADLGEFCRGLPPIGEMNAVRSEAWVRWRFSGNPMAEYVKVECRDHAGKLIGIAAGRITTAGPIRIGWLVDIAVSTPDVTACVVSGLARELRSGGAHLVATVASARRQVDDLKSLGFWRIHPRFARKRLYTVWSPRSTEPPSRAIPESVANWWLTLADWDGM